MILTTAIGWALQSFAGIPNALVFGLLFGLIAAPLIPAPASCGVPRRD